MEKRKTLSTVEEIKAYNDHYRMEILFTIEKLGRPATCKEIADIMKEVPSKVHYHIKKMEKAEILEMVQTKEINGIIAKYYLPTAEEFNITNKYMDKASKSIMDNETDKLIERIFDNAKNGFIGTVQKLRGDKCTEEGNIHHGDLYLTEDQAKDLKEYVSKIMKDNKNDKNSNYNVFFSIIKTKKS